MKSSRRQVHETKGSYYIYIPKSWIKRNEVEKDSELVALEYFDGSLLLKNDIDSNKTIKEREVKISIDEIGSNKKLLFNYILASYIIGAERITIFSSSKIPISVRENVSTQIRLLPGFEIIKEDSNLIEAKEIGQISDISSIIETLLSSTLIMLKSINELDITIDKEELKHELKSIMARDDDIDRFRYMVDRQSHLLLSDPYLSVTLKLNPVSTLHYAQIATYIERIGDHTVQLSDFFKGQVDNIEDVYPFFGEYLSTSISSFELLIELYHNGNYIQALEQLDHLHTIEKSIFKKLQKSNYNLGLYHIGRIIGYCINIMEIILDQTAYDELFIEPGLELSDKD